MHVLYTLEVTLGVFSRARPVNARGRAQCPCIALTGPALTTRSRARAAGRLDERSSPRLHLVQLLDGRPLPGAISGVASAVVQGSGFNGLAIDLLPLRQNDVAATEVDV